MASDLEHIKDRVIADLNATTDLRAWDALRVAILGKSGELTALLKQLGQASPEERKTRGAALNTLKSDLTTAIDARRETLESAALNAKLAAERVDITLPSRPEPPGAIHPISRTIEEMTAIFGAMGFEVGDGFDIQSDWYNFGALNIPAHHPARADQDTFYLNGDTTPPRLLRTQTSDVQIISLLTREPPFRVIAPGRTYRADHDATHSPMFHQCEGIVIDRAISLAHLKGCLTDFLRAYFDNPNLPIRFRASYFPFTEPSMEVDIGWNRRTGDLGAGGDWLEILGSGMVHPRVLANCGVDPREWQGFAFGMGIERVAMLKAGIPDLRPFFESDLRWLRHYGFSALAPASLHEGLR
jgi:phenylalanyl-tRNA synthetase alpha chain